MEKEKWNKRGGIVRLMSSDGWKGMMPRHPRRSDLGERGVHLLDSVATIMKGRQRSKETSGFGPGHVEVLFWFLFSQ